MSAVRIPGDLRLPAIREPDADGDDLAPRRGAAAQPDALLGWAFLGAYRSGTSMLSAFILR